LEEQEKAQKHEVKWWSKIKVKSKRDDWQETQYESMNMNDSINQSMIFNKSSS